MIEHETETDLDRERIDDAMASLQSERQREAMQRAIERTGDIVCGTLTLRDFMAAIWMWGQIGSPDEMARQSYAVADAMLKRRNEVQNA